MFNWLINLIAPSKRETTYKLSELGYEEAARLGLVNGSCDGVAVDEWSILALGTLWRAARVLSESVGNLPCKIYEKDKRGIKVEAKEHPLFKLVSSRPHPQFSTQEFWQLLVWNAILYGTGIAQIEREGAMPVRLMPIHSKRFTWVPDWQWATTGTYYLDGQPVLPDDFIIIRGPSPDGSLGYKLTQIARDAFSYFISTERYGSEYFKNFCDVGGWLKFPPGMGDQAKDNIIKSLENRSRGIDRVGQIGALEDGCDFVGNQRNNEQGQYHQTRERNATEICKYVGVDPFLCFEYGRATWGNAAEGTRNFLTFSLNTWLIKAESEMDYKVILPSDQETYCIEFDRSALVEMDAKQQADIWALGVQNGWIDPEEVRSSLGLPPRELPPAGPVAAPPPGATPPPPPVQGGNNAGHQ